MNESTGQRESMDELRNQIKSLKAELKQKEREIKELKKRSRRRKPDKKDVIAILRFLGVEISPGKEHQLREFWQEVIYPSRFLKRGTARKEMVLKCEDIHHPWGTEPVRQAINLLMEHDILTKKGTHYAVNLSRLNEICE